jgi:hypothetical protein
MTTGGARAESLHNAREGIVGLDGPTADGWSAEWDGEAEDNGRRPESDGTSIAAALLILLPVCAGGPCVVRLRAARGVAAEAGRPAFEADLAAKRLAEPQRRAKP